MSNSWLYVNFLNASISAMLTAPKGYTMEPQVVAIVKSRKRATIEDVEIGQRIRAHRNSRRLSQTELANSLGVTFQQVQKYEKGVNRVPGVRLAQIAKLFDVPITQLLPGGTGSQEPHIAGEWLFQLIQERPIVELLRVLNDVPQPSRKDVVHAVREIVYALHSVRG